MNEKHHEVQQWLDTIFGGDDYPNYEVNQVTIETLWKLKQKNQRQDQATTLIIEDFHQKAAEYAIQADRMSQILGQVGLSPSALSQSGTVSLRTLVSAALRLNTKDASHTNLILALGDRSHAAVRVSDARKLEKKLSSQLLAKTKAAHSTYTALHKALLNLEEETRCQGPDLEQKAQQAGFLQSKGKEYRKLFSQLQEDLKASAVEPSIYHDRLCRKAEDLQDLRDKLQPVRAKLDSYQKLPPDLALARVKIEEARKELESIEEKLSNEIDMMHM